MLQHRHYRSEIEKVDQRHRVKADMQEQRSCFERDRAQLIREMQVLGNGASRGQVAPAEERENVAPHHEHNPELSADLAAYRLW